MSTSTTHAKGFTLLEVMVALVVLSVGLLGLAALQTATVRFNQNAYLRSQATNFAYDLADRMRANREAAIAGDQGGKRVDTDVIADRDILQPDHDAGAVYLHIDADGPQHGDRRRGLPDLLRELRCARHHRQVQQLFERQRSKVGARGGLRRRDRWQPSDQRGRGQGLAHLPGNRL